MTEHRLAGGATRVRPALASAVEALEGRVLLSVTSDAHDHAAEIVYLPPRAMLSSKDGLLTAPAPGRPLDVALSYLADRAGDLGFTPADLENAAVTDQYTDADTGVTHIYLRQRVNKLDVANAELSIHLTRDNEVIAAGGGFVPVHGPGQAPAAGVPVRTAARGLRDAAGALGLTLKAAPTVVRDATGVARSAVLRARAASVDDVPARLQYVPTPQGLRLAWRVVLRTPDGDHWYDAGVDAASGELLSLNDWASDFASYNVFASPLEHPGDGPRSVDADPEDLTASPFGWHDTNGAAGAEFTDTRGNNVSAQDDVDFNNSGGSRPNGGAALDFDFPLDLTQAPAAYRPAAITNLFYWNNLVHDVHYRYGFTEAAGNYQTNNYGRGGAGNDAVQADAQDGQFTNNARFFAPPDGTPGRMEMFLFNITNPGRDGDLANEIIIHEYGHGVSVRLTGGPANSNSLDALQSGGMGEGWSDWWALMLTQKSSDVPGGRFPTGTYVLGQNPVTGAGVRRRPYSFDLAIDPLTFDHFGTTGTVGGIARSTEVHDAGEIWCSALWDLNWLLINKYGYSRDISQGYDPNVPGRNGGNNLALRLVMDALKLQPANPSFVQARDAILSADQALTGGENKLQIWQAFSRRGLGVAAATASATSGTVTTSFALPSTPGVQNPQVVSRSLTHVQSGPVSQIEFTFNTGMDPASFALDDIPAFTGPGGMDLRPQMTGFSWLNGNTTLRVTFNAQAVPGAYSMQVGPDILSAALVPMDQDADGAAGEAGQDRFTANFAVRAPAVASSAPSGTVFSPPTSADFTFTQPMDPTSFSVASDVASFTGPGGDDLRSQITGFSWRNGNTTLALTFNTQTTPGAYALAIGPQILSATGAALDQDADLLTGESPDDRYTARFSFAAPRVTASFPSGQRIDPVSSFDFTFNQPMDPASFSIPADLPSFTGPGGDLVNIVTGLSWLNGNTTLRINFAPQSARGTYSMTVGPQVRSPAGVAMDQDEDALAGEAQQDAFTATVTIDPNLGPDAFGYTASAASLSGIDLVPGGPGVVNVLDARDEGFAAIPLGTNTFRFYGNPYTGNQLFVNTNGLITFGTGTSARDNTDLSASPTQASVAVLWTDLMTNAGPATSSVLYRFDDTDADGTPDRLVVEWNDVPHFNNIGAATFQAVLQLNTGAASGDVLLSYPDLDFGNATYNNGASATVGIKAAGAAGGNRLLVSQDTGASPFVGTGKAVRFTTTDITPPAVGTAAYRYQVTPNEVRFTFSEGVAAPAAASLSVQPVAGGPPVSPAGVSYDAGTRTATFALGAALPDGNYRATLAAAGVTDAAGNPLPTDYVLEFFALAGDANRDRAVNSADFVTLASNFGRTGRTYEHADFNGDGTVNTTDFTLLAANFGRTVPPPAAGALPPQTPALVVSDSPVPKVRAAAPRPRRAARRPAGAGNAIGV